MAYKISVALVLLLGTPSGAQVGHILSPLTPLPQKFGGFEVVSGDPDKAGVPFVVRIANDAGYVVLPHTHPEDENIVVVKGSWSVAMGNRVERARLQPMELGAYTFVPKKSAHFGWSRTATIIQVHGIGPFSTDFVDPVYELAETGVSLIRTAGRPGQRVESAPADCFDLEVGDRVRHGSDGGKVVGALCLPVSRFTQYWIETSEGQRFWSTLAELKKL